MICDPNKPPIYTFHCYQHLSFSNSTSQNPFDLHTRARKPRPNTFTRVVNHKSHKVEPSIGGFSRTVSLFVRFREISCVLFMSYIAYA